MPNVAKMTEHGGLALGPDRPDAVALVRKEGAGALTQVDHRQRESLGMLRGFDGLRAGSRVDEMNVRKTLRNKALGYAE